MSDELRSRIAALKHQLAEQEEDALRETVENLPSADEMSDGEKIAVFNHLHATLMRYINRAVDKGHWFDSDEAFYFEVAMQALFGEVGSKKAWEIINEIRV